MIHGDSGCSFLSSSRILGCRRGCAGGGTPSSGPEGLEHGVGQALGPQPKLHMGLAVLTAPLEPVGFAREQRGAGWRRECVGGSREDGAAPELPELPARAGGSAPPPAPPKAAPHSIIPQRKDFNSDKSLTFLVYGLMLSVGAQRDHQSSSLPSTRLNEMLRGNWD